MDEKTRRVNAMLPDDLMEFLDRLAKRRGFKSRARALRFCIQEEREHQAGRQPVAGDR